ncbi:MAG: class I SAM-dependent rRNA methyltransferase [Blastocatellia bacterium]|nr:class I SAM-dependent rRNA methyltransferase [Blastocatellia bacterium]MBN8724056.1 class I SAM-dependent rRNA methyltransferase [Acidobacteriota bacterium]
MAEVAVTRKGQQRIEQGHLWIYRSDITLQGKDPSPGSIVKVLSAKKEFLGQAFYSSLSQIALRMLTSSKENIDDNFWKKRLQTAFNLRNKVVNNAEAYRLLHGEADLIPSLVIDRYQNHFVIQTLSQGTDLLKNTWVKLLVELFQPEAIVERNDVKVRKLEGLSEQIGLLMGSLPKELTVKQNSLAFYADLLEGQKTGLFLDQRENHLTAQKYAQGKALDCFTFNGGFALNMAQTANTVLAVDVSENAITQAKKNATLNNVTNISFEVANVFDLLKSLDEQKELFDIIVLDPPAFAKNRGAVTAAIRGYKEINLRAIKLLKPGGILISCTCSYNVSEEVFLGIIQSAAIDAGRQLQLLEKRVQSRDHPILLSVSETYYLKCMILRVL